jgi:hypothetical protein
MKWDAAWYLKIVTAGYSYTDSATVQSSVAFYPLYPLVSYVVKSVFRIDADLALFVVANVASAGLLLLMTKFVKDELGERVSLLTVAFFFFFPSSLFLSAGYSESLCLLLMILSFVLMARRNFILAALVGGLSVATHTKTIGIVPVIIWETWRQSERPFLNSLARVAFCGFLAIAGLLVYMLYLGLVFHHPLAFVTAHRAWEGGTLVGRFIFSATLGPFRHFHVTTGGWFLCALALTIWSFRRLRFALSLYGVIALAVPYFSLGITDSMNRFVLMCLPAFMFLGWLCRERPWLTNALIGIFAALLLRNAALFSQCYWVG